MRADLEALVDTSPVGVLVLDARTARPVYFNREARRIAEGVRLPDRALEDVLDLLRCRFSDGRVVALDEFPLAQELSNAQTVLAEEIVFSAPDGPQHQDADQRHAGPFRGRHGRVGGGDHAGSCAAGGTGALAGGVPEHGESRTAHPAGRDPGVGRQRAARSAGPRPGRGAPVLPHHQRAGGSRPRPDQRPARRGPHRLGHAVRGARALGSRRVGGGGRGMRSWAAAAGMPC